MNSLLSGNPPACTAGRVAEKPGHDSGEVAQRNRNGFRLWFASMAYVLVNSLRRLALQTTDLADATCGTIRRKLFKIGALVTVSVRRIKFAMASGSLRARPAIRLVNGASERFGTFELWHRSARSLPLGGKLTDFRQNVSLSRFQAVLTQDDKRLPLLPEWGITLLECLSSLPRMRTVVHGYGITPDMVRATLTATVRPDTQTTCDSMPIIRNKSTYSISRAAE